MHHVQHSCAFDFWVTGRVNCWWSVVPQEPRCRHDTWSIAPAAWCLECFFRPWSQLLNPCLNFFFFFFTQTDTIQATRQLKYTHKLSFSDPYSLSSKCVCRLSIPPSFNPTRRHLLDRHSPPPAAHGNVSDQPLGTVCPADRIPMATLYLY